MITGGHVGLGFFSRWGSAASSNPVEPPVGRPILPWPRLSGVARTGETLTVEAPALSNIQGYQWYVDDVEMTDVTGPSMTANTMGHVSVLVTADDGVFAAPIVQVLHGHAISEHAGHAVAEDAVLALTPHVSASHIAVQDGLWSDPMTWDVGAVPGDGAVVLVPIGVNVAYDVATAPRLDRLRVDGALRVALDQSTQMHVETVVIAHSGLLEIGAGFESRLPGMFEFELIISDRAYAISPSMPSDLDLANDPLLMGRGIICLGNFVVFGDERKRHVKTANGSAPLAGDISLHLAHSDHGWQVGDDIILPGTAYEQIGGVTQVYDERRIITGVFGAIITWVEPLQFDHGHQNSAVTRTDLQPSVANMAANVVVRSESAELQRRGHIMIMHDGFSDVWDLGIKEMGRTDTVGAPGVILSGGQYRYFDPNTLDVETTATPNAANRKGRYPFHFHFCGFKRNDVPRVHNSVIDGSPGWGLVHHGCEAEIFGNVVYGWAGAGIVAETGDETGVWGGNFSFGSRSQEASYGTVKLRDGTISSGRGLKGDFARHGVAFYFRGRAVKSTDNVAASAAQAYAFFHRTTGNPANSLSPQIRLRRDSIGLSDMYPIHVNSVDDLDTPDHPILHFARNEAFGCVTGFNVTKVDVEQGHGVPSYIDRFKAWGVVSGIDTEYVGYYRFNQPDLVSTAFAGDGYQVGRSRGIFWNDHTVKMIAIQPTVEGFAQNIEIDGSSSSTFALSNDMFSQTDPRFIVDRPTLIGNQVINYTSRINPGSQTATTQSVTKVYTSEPTYMAAPTVDVPFIVADWSGSALLSSPTAYTNIQTGTKTDSVGIQPIPKLWDDMSIGYENSTPQALLQYAQENGYYTYGADNILVFHQYYSDDLTGITIRKAHAIRITGSEVDIAPALNSNGEWPAASANAPDHIEVSLPLSPGGTTIDIVSLVSDLDGDTLTLVEQYAGSTSGSFEVDVVSGTGTYTPHLNIPNEDTVQAFVSDGTGQYATVKINFTPATVPVVLSFGQSNTPYNTIPSSLTDAGISGVERLTTAVGGTSVSQPAGGWNVTTGDGTDAPGTQFVNMQATIDSYLAANPTHYIAAAVTGQGEAELNTSAGDNFITTATDLNNAIRAHVGSNIPIFSFVMSSYQTQISSHPNFEDVRRQQREMADPANGIYVLETDDIFTAAGLSITDAMRYEALFDPNYLHYSLPVGQKARSDALVALPEFIAAVTP